MRQLKNFGCHPSDLQLKDKKISVIGCPEKSVSIEDALVASPDRMGKMLMGKGHYDPPSELSNRQTGIANIASAYSFGAQGVEVEVDKETGKVRVVHVVAVYDIGRRSILISLKDRSKAEFSKASDTL